MAWFPEGGSRKRNDGCQWCGLMGCDCPADGSPPPGQAAMRLRHVDKVCGKCKRDKADCLCVSTFKFVEKHEDKKEAKKDSAPPAPPPPVRRRPYTAHDLRVLVREGMAFYYHNDPAGLARWMEKELA